LLLILTIGGGFVGLLLTAPFFFHVDKVVAYIALLAFVGLYGWGIFLGVRLSEGSASLRDLRFYFALQIPFISSPVIEYRFATGFQVTIAMIQSGLRCDWRLGSEGQLGISSQAPWGIGINIVAVAIVLLLYSRFAVVPQDALVSRPNQSLEPTAGRRDARV
jgi:hypothetical protein